MAARHAEEIKVDPEVTSRRSRGGLEDGVLTDGMHDLATDESRVSDIAPDLKGEIHTGSYRVTGHRFA